MLNVVWWWTLQWTHGTPQITTLKMDTTPTSPGWYLFSHMPVLCLQVLPAPGRGAGQHCPRCMAGEPGHINHIMRLSYTHALQGEPVGIVPNGNPILVESFLSPLKKLLSLVTEFSKDAEQKALLGTETLVRSQTLLLTVEMLEVFEHTHTHTQASLSLCLTPGCVSEETEVNKRKRRPTRDMQEGSKSC
ncbi:hypothetical protein F2P79_009124 [Pimephales promelas]|nr:hypothetical protein F2P79_009124 [Pimephales promelas]